MAFPCLAPTCVHSRSIYHEPWGCQRGVCLADKLARCCHDTHQGHLCCSEASIGLPPTLEVHRVALLQVLDPTTVCGAPADVPLQGGVIFVKCSASYRDI
jgi:hypothetical protein